jgi:hypothetical protein
MAYRTSYDDPYNQYGDDPQAGPGVPYTPSGQSPTTASGQINTGYQYQQQSQYNSPGEAVPDQSQGGLGQSQSGAWTPSSIYDLSKWDTDNYAAPQWMPDAYNQQTPGGWEQTKWSNPNYLSPKYAIGKILSNYPANVNGLKAAFEDIKRAYPGAEWDGKDKIRLPTLGPGWIDVGQAFSKLQEGQYGPDVVTSWQWITDDGGAGGGGGGGTGGTGGGYGNVGAGNIQGLLDQFWKYDPSSFPQFNAPNMEPYQSNLLNSLNTALSNSEWSPQRVAAQKEVQKEQALKMGGQLEQQLAQRFAAQGRTNSGAYDAGRTDIGQENVAQILNAYRGIDENAATNRRQELISTAAALDAALSGVGNRATEFYQAQMTPYQMALQKALGYSGAANEWARWLENQRQFNEGLGLDYAKANMSWAGA